ncbi:TIGR03089 family protein [Haloechinothrix sp. LS1_15]|uniref:TIGR03089 family protein n=1 Tax=Haloechinothrix sp. LS1_15 TaxID=2652248 RepID=UPI0029474139|nr:TIGR03089 family protein [Haloechinothrix sp. LS1_15]MDV6013925.1 TIGR03089 family protein [Haloechinothrix sp. LS1_15]
MSITETVLRPLLAASAARPLITHYDEDAGSRVELSVATATNWAAKTANWLTEEFDVEPGDAVCVRLPAHWQTAAVLLGAWWCGGHVTDSPEGAAVAFTVVGQQDAVSAAGATAVVALDPLGRGLSEATRPPMFDYLADVKACGDEFVPPQPVPGEAPALLSSTVDEVLATARERAAASGIAAGDRVLSTRDWTLPDGVLGALLAPLAAGASLVQVTGVAHAAAPDRRQAERTTVEIA